MTVTAAAWPEADALFRGDPRWMGSDDAYSIPLSPGRTLWLFGDTFVGDGVDPDRANAAFVRNSIGIMTGDDPSSATMRFAWGDGPASFFPSAPGTWLWPLHGARVGDRLLVFFMLVRPSDPNGPGGIEDWRTHGSYGFFDVFGWTAFWVDDVDREPADWRLTEIGPFPDAEIVAGAAVCDSYVYGWDRARLRLYVAQLDGASMRWWDGGGWGGAPAPVVQDGYTEFTVHRIGARYCMTAVHGGRAGVLSLRWADAPQGPWSAPVAVFEPEEARRPDAMVYAGKAHPHLIGADLVTTYASNAEADVTLKDPSLYYPRFVRLWFDRDVTS